MSQNITPNLWFNGNAKEAADFYVNAFPDSSLGSITYYPKTKEEGLADFQTDLAGKELVVPFSLGGQAFVGINAGPEFTPNPSISFMVNFDPSQNPEAEADLNKLWEQLTGGGSVLMELGEYPYSKRYGWVQDRYNVSWQLILTNPSGEPRPFIIPSLLFTQAADGKAEEAINFYLSVFDGAKLGTLAHYESNDGPAAKGSVMFADFTLKDQWFTAMDGGNAHQFGFTEGISLSVDCKDQAEIDYLWDKLSAVPESEQCGWCKDRYGVSWQIVPQNMDELMSRPGAYPKMMEMKKLIIADF